MKPVTSERTNTPGGGASPSVSLPEKPLVTVEATKSWKPLDLRSLWTHRELMYFLVWRDLKVRYRQTLIGVAWAILQPLAMAIVYSLVLGLLIRVDTGDVPYPLFVYSGILVYMFFQGAVANSSVSMVASSNLITKVYFPRLIIPIASVGGHLVDLAIASVILVGMALFYGVPLTTGLLMVPVLIVLVTLFSLGIGIWSSAVNVKYRDVTVVVPVVLRIWLYASPVIYPITLIPDGWRWLYSLNPMVGIVQNFRAAVLGLPFDWPALGVSVLVALAVLAYAVNAFRRVEQDFADII
jgi:lipopolysaccharide transport system permease protein